MKVVIFAGGRGSRLDSNEIPKPLVPIGGKPILWHIMKYYSSFGHNDFIILTGYQSYLIKEYFEHYLSHNSDIIFDFNSGNKTYINCKTDKWKVTVLDTGLETLTGGRLLQAKNYINNEDFMLTYGDGVSNVNLTELLLNYSENKSIVTLTATQTAGRFGTVKINANNKIDKFKEKPIDDDSWINGGFMVVSPKIFPCLQESDFSHTLDTLSVQGELSAYKHTGFWRCMDTPQDRATLEELWSNDPVWKVW